MSATGERVPLGTPITAEQAARAVLRMIHSPIVGNIDADTSPGHTLQRLQDEKRGADGTTPYAMLSTGERRLVDIAWALWAEPTEVHHAEITAIGGLDPTLRRKVLVVLLYRYLGHDVRLDFDLTPDEFVATFGGPDPFKSGR